MKKNCNKIKKKQIIYKKKIKIYLISIQLDKFYLKN